MYFARRHILSLLSLLSSLSAVAAEAPTDKQICAAGIAAMMGRDAKTVRTDRIDGRVFYQSYIRPGDGTVWRYKCQIEGNRVMWGADDGRWRRHELDEVISFTWTTGKLTIWQKGFDSEPMALKVFSLAQLSRDK